jgi:hypothetical protein
MLGKHPGSSVSSVFSVVVAAFEVIGLRLRLVSGIPVSAGFRESDAWWNNSFRSLARLRSRH